MCDRISECVSVTTKVNFAKLIESLILTILSVKLKSDYGVSMDRDSVFAHFTIFVQFVHCYFLLLSYP